MKQEIYNFDEAALKLGLGRNTLFKKLRELNVLNKENVPYRCYIDAGYFKTEQKHWTHPKTQVQKLAIKSLITLRGIGWVELKLNQEPQTGKQVNERTA